MEAKFTDQLLTHLARRIIRKNKDKGRRNVANDEEEYTLVYRERGQVFGGSGMPPPFSPFWFYMFSNHQLSLLLCC